MTTKIIAGIRCTLIPNISHIHANSAHVGILFTYNKRVHQGILPRALWDAALIAPIQNEKESTQVNRAGSPGENVSAYENCKDSTPAAPTGSEGPASPAPEEGSAPAT